MSTRPQPLLPATNSNGHYIPSNLAAQESRGEATPGAPSVQSAGSKTELVANNKLCLSSIQ